MNKLLSSFWSLLLLAATVATTSCGTDTEEVTPAAPSITLSAADETGTTVNVGEAVTFTVSVNAPGGFNVIRVDKTVGTGSTVQFDEETKTPGQTVTSFTYNFAYTPTSDEAGQNIYFDFEVVDDAGLTSTHEFVVTVNEPAILTYQTVLLGGQQNSTEGSFYNARDNQVYLMAAAKNNKDKVDLLYYFGANNLATIAAPTDADSHEVFGTTNLQGMVNATNFVRTTAAFANITTASHISNAWLEQKSGQVDTKVINLKVGDVFAFQLADARGYRLGVAEVVGMDNTTAGSRKITLNIKTQSTDN